MSQFGYWNPRGTSNGEYGRFAMFTPSRSSTNIPDSGNYWGQMPGMGTQFHGHNDHHHTHNSCQHTNLSQQPAHTHQHQPGCPNATQAGDNNAYTIQYGHEAAEKALGGQPQFQMQYSFPEQANVTQGNQQQFMRQQPNQTQPQLHQYNPTEQRVNSAMKDMGRLSLDPNMPKPSTPYCLQYPSSQPQAQPAQTFQQQPPNFQSPACPGQTPAPAFCNNANSPKSDTKEKTQEEPEQPQETTMSAAGGDASTAAQEIREPERKMNTASVSSKPLPTKWKGFPIPPQPNCGRPLQSQSYAAAKAQRSMSQMNNDSNFQNPTSMAAYQNMDMRGMSPASQDMGIGDGPGISQNSNYTVSKTPSKSSSSVSSTQMKKAATTPKQAPTLCGRCPKCKSYLPKDNGPTTLVFPQHNKKMTPTKSLQSMVQDAKNFKAVRYGHR